MTTQPTTYPSYTSAGSGNRKRKKKKRAGGGAKWNVGDYVAAGFLLLCLTFFTVAAVVAGIPNGIAQFEAPTDAQLTTISGKPSSEGVEKWVMPRGIKTVLAFSVADRDFLLEGANWNGEEGLQPIAHEIKNCDVLSLKVTDKGIYKSSPFWEMKADGRVIVSKQEMINRHNSERYIALLVPIIVVLVALLAVTVGAFHFFSQTS